MTNSNESVIAEFESGWTGHKDSLHDFIRKCEPVASSDLQFELLRRDLRLRLRFGSMPTQSDYEEHFPHFVRDIESTIISEAESIARDEEPIEKLLGPLPRTVGGYEVVELVGRDGVSVHYDAYQNSLSRKVRFRVLLFPTEESINKACTIANLEHPSFENVIDVLRVGSTCAIVSQVEHGESVSEWVSNRPVSITVRQVARWISDVADSMLELHRHDVEHLNVSPSTLVARHSGGGVLIEPNFVCPVGNISGNRAGEFHCLLPFPYRSITGNIDDSQSRRRDDVVALGLVMFVLLTKISLESFYFGAPLPGETKRLKTLVKSHLDYNPEIDPTLKLLCLRTTLGVMDDVNPCELTELRNALSEWAKLDDLRVRNEWEFHDKHSQSESLASSIARSFTWFSKQ